MLDVLVCEVCLKGSRFEYVIKNKGKKGSGCQFCKFKNFPADVVPFDTLLESVEEHISVAFIPDDGGNNDGEQCLTTDMLDSAELMEEVGFTPANACLLETVRRHFAGSGWRRRTPSETPSICKHPKNQVCVGGWTKGRMNTDIFGSALYLRERRRHYSWLLKYGLITHRTEYIEAWLALRDSDPEAALCAAAFRGLFEEYGAEVKSDSGAISATRFLCEMSGKKFIIQTANLIMDIDTPRDTYDDMHQTGLRNEGALMTQCCELLERIPERSAPLLLAVCAYGPSGKYTYSPIIPWNFLFGVIKCGKEPTRCWELFSGMIICGHTMRGGHVAGALNTDAKYPFDKDLLPTIRFMEKVTDPVP